MLNTNNNVIIKRVTELDFHLKVLTNNNRKYNNPVFLSIYIISENHVKFLNSKSLKFSWKKSVPNVWIDTIIQVNLLEIKLKSFKNWF